MKRFLSLAARNLSDKKDVKKTLETLRQWQPVLSNLPTATTRPQTLALIRLDDIGDYLLFRNFLHLYRHGSRFAGYKVTLIGNEAWKPLSEQFDKDYVDEWIWVNKEQYFSNDSYRLNLWNDLRKRGFEQVVCSTRTRPLLLDDMLALATGAANSHANNNTFRFEEWNDLSDKHYNHIYADKFDTHEFIFNRAFNNWAAGASDTQQRPELPVPEKGNALAGGICCFIGATAKSRRWTTSNWIQLIKLLKKEGHAVVISGGKQEADAANEIVSATGAMSIAGRTSLVQTMQWIAHAKAVITGDTMAAHAAVSYNRPTLILSNGVNAARFVAYGAAGVGGTAAMYAAPYTRYLSKGGNPFDYYDGVTDDLQAIDPEAVAQQLEQLLKDTKA